MRTKTIVATNGQEVNISVYVNKMIRILSYGEPDDQEEIDFLRKFGAQLIIVAGPDAPDKIIDECAKYIRKKDAAYLRELWEPLASDYREGWSQPMKSRR